MIHQHRILFLFVAVLLATTSCSRESLGGKKAFIVNGGDNSVDVFDLKKLRFTKTRYLKTDSGFFAHHINLSPGRKYLSIALPRYDFQVVTKVYILLIPPGRYLY